MGRSDLAGNIDKLLCNPKVTDERHLLLPVEFEIGNCRERRWIRQAAGAGAGGAWETGIHRESQENVDKPGLVARFGTRSLDPACRSQESAGPSGGAVAGDSARRRHPSP